ncbi:MAG: hypothetical protein CL726_00065 [Chloroflexi bacterium]|nr:hypothetical protein [Chloroflexota bacterium]
MTHFELKTDRFRRERKIPVSGYFCWSRHLSTFLGEDLDRQLIDQIEVFKSGSTPRGLVIHEHQLEISE